MSMPTPIHFRTRANLRARGFTLMEMIVVIGIIMLLAGALFAYTGPLRERTRRAATKKLVESVYNATEQYRLDFRAYPPDSFGAYNGIESLTYFLTTAFRRNPNLVNGEVSASINAGPYLQLQPSELADLSNGAKRMSIVDPWRSPLKYRLDSSTQNDVWDTSKTVVNYIPTVYSYGPNRADDNGKVDDILLGQ
jgi:prepilin-type N-terminal cleavage/methylation domain-containing protein